MNDWRTCHFVTPTCWLTRGLGEPPTARDERMLVAGVSREVPMWWILGGAAFLVGLWIVGPTLRTFLRRDFEPVRRNDAIVFQAQQTSHP